VREAEWIGAYEEPAWAKAHPTYWIPAFAGMTAMLNPCESRLIRVFGNLPYLAVSTWFSFAFFAFFVVWRSYLVLRCSYFANKWWGKPHPTICHDSYLRSSAFRLRRIFDICGCMCVKRRS